MVLLHDNLLVREVVKDGNIKGTNLKYKYDDDDPFMEVEVIDVSKEFIYEYCKYYSNMEQYEAKLNLAAYYSVGSRLLIRRINKLPYKDGLFFISFKDIIASLSATEGKEESSDGRE